MSETLYIKNFGPIKDVKIELKKINILIGDQGTGKSTVGKLFSLLKNFISLIIFNPTNSEKERDETWQFHEYLTLFEIKSYLSKNTIIIYENGLTKAKFLYENGNVSINFKREALLPPSFNYIVAERVFVSTLSDAFFGLNQFGTKLPTLFNRFGNKFSTARKENYRVDYKEILNVDFSHKDGVDSIVLEDGSIIPLSDSSSGMQSTIPLLVVYDNIVANIRPTNNTKLNHLMVIEEPELNLYPTTQYKLLSHIVSKNYEFKSYILSREIDKRSIEEEVYEREYKNQLIITTHSPYILTSLNNLMFAFEIGKESEIEVEKIINKQNWVNAVDVSAYKLKDGCAEDIIDRELNQIKVDKIDEISEELSRQWHQLAEIKFEKRG